MSSMHMRTAHGLQILKQKHPLIRSLNKAGSRPSIYGTQVWQSSYFLMEYLAEHPLEQHQRLMEVGCGWGLLGIFCAKQFAVDALLTDADEQVFAYVMTHARLNQVSVRTEHVRFEGVTHRHLRECDILLGADICFWPELGTQLRRLIERALSSGLQTILLADPGRASFMQLAKYCQYHFDAKMIRQQAARRAESSGYVLVIEQDNGG